MKPLVIDGIFYTKKITGIQRYAIEITKELDKIVEKGRLIILVPKWCKTQFNFANIRVIRYGKHSNRIWEQIDLPCFLHKHKLDGIFFENTIPIFYRKGIATVHDISLKTHPEYYCNSIKGLVSIVWRRFLYRLIFSSNMKIVTVSYFSKKEILDNYEINSDRITVVYNAWQHMDSITEDKDALNKYSLIESEYFFSMATLAPNKNFKWIIEAAKANPNEIFSVAGGGRAEKLLGKEKKPANLLFLGYVTDQEAKSLMKNCKAFIYPSLYEGFGIPPLEAVACGAPMLLLSDIPVFREVYGCKLSFFNPKNYGCNIDETIKGNSRNDDILCRYSWEQSAWRFARVFE